MASKNEAREQLTSRIQLASYSDGWVAVDVYDPDEDGLVADGGDLDRIATHMITPQEARLLANQLFEAASAAESLEMAG